MIVQHKTVKSEPRDTPPPKSRLGPAPEIKFADLKSYSSDKKTIVKKEPKDVFNRLDQRANEVRA